MRIVFTIWFLTCLYIRIPGSAFAQEEQQSINLETVPKLCGADNLTIHEFQLSYKLALAKQTKAKEWWLPVIYAGIRTHYLEGAAMNTDGSILIDFDRNNAWAGAGVGLNIDFNKGV